MSELTPDEIEVGRQNLIAQLRAASARAYVSVDLDLQTVADLIGVLEALKPVVVDRAALREQIYTEVYNAGSPPMREWIEPKDLYVMADAVLAGFSSTEALAQRAEVNEAFGYAWSSLRSIVDVSNSLSARMQAQTVMDQLRSLYPKATEGKS